MEPYGTFSMICELIPIVLDTQSSYLIMIKSGSTYDKILEVTASTLPGYCSAEVGTGCRRCAGRKKPGRFT